MLLIGCAPQQAQLSERALELLALPEDGVPRLLLDLGCGSCLSGDAISEAGHTWVVRCFPYHTPHERPGPGLVTCSACCCSWAAAPA